MLVRYFCFVWHALRQNCIRHGRLCVHRRTSNKQWKFNKESEEVMCWMKVDNGAEASSQPVDQPRSTKTQRSWRVCGGDDRDKRIRDTRTLTIWRRGTVLEHGSSEPSVREKQTPTRYMYLWSGYSWWRSLNCTLFEILSSTSYTPVVASASWWSSNTRLGVKSHGKSNSSTGQALFDELNDSSN